MTLDADTTIRELTARDVALLEAMSAMFADAFDEPDTYTGKPPRRSYLARLPDDGAFIALAALREGAVIGGLVAYELRKFEQERSEIYVYDLAVAGPHRRRGIATALFATLKAIARARGAYVIFVQADRGDEPAIALYDGLGTREEVLHFDIEPD